MPFALWTRAAIGALIQAKFGIRMPVRTIGHYLKRWGFTPQKPLKRAYEQRPDAIPRGWRRLSQRSPRAPPRRRGDPLGRRDESEHERSARPRLRAPRQDAGAQGGLAPEVGEFSLHGDQSGQSALHGAQGALSAQILIRFLRRLIRDTNHACLSSSTT